MSSSSNLNIKIFADGADMDHILALYKDKNISGFTTNPTLMKKSGITDYEKFGREVLAAIPDRPVSLEVFADEIDEMAKQARAIASWGGQVNVKIPVMNTKGEPTGDLIKELSAEGIVLNITAIFTEEQVQMVCDALYEDTPAIVSVFAGRIADTGQDPIPAMTSYRDILKAKPKAELLWASPREVLNIYQADWMGCHIITVTPDLLKKLNLAGKDLHQYSKETVEMFYNDATSAGYSISV